MENGVTELSRVQQALSALFPPDKLGWKPQASKGDRAMACAYIDARDVQDRLDEVVGVGAWQDHYDILPDGSVMCQLRVKIDGEWVAKTDVGGLSAQPDPGDRLKAAFSDALKRAAVKFGIGRYLYSLPSVWHDYDQQKKQFRSTPPLPAWAIPKRAGTTPPHNGQQQQPAPRPPAPPPPQQQSQPQQNGAQQGTRTDPKNLEKFLGLIAGCKSAAELEQCDGAINAGFNGGQLFNDCLPAVNQRVLSAAKLFVEECTTPPQYRQVADVLLRSVYKNLPDDLKATLTAACKAVKARVEAPAAHPAPADDGPPTREPMDEDDFLR